MANVTVKYNPFDETLDRATPAEIAARLADQDGLWVRFKDADGNIVRPFAKGSFLHLFENDFCLMGLPADEMTTLDKFEDLINYQGLQLGELRQIARLLNKATPPV